MTERELVIGHVEERTVFWAPQGAGTSAAHRLGVDPDECLVRRSYPAAQNIENYLAPVHGIYGNFNNLHGRPVSILPWTRRPL